MLEKTSKIIKSNHQPNTAKLPWLALSSVSEIDEDKERDLICQ